MLTAPIRSSASASEKPSRQDELRNSIEHAAHFLPAQGPITAFVHHNTLHAFEHLPFEEAVVAGAKVYGCHPYLSEDAYLAKLNDGRIRRADLQAVLIDDLGERGDVLLGFLGTRFQLRMSMLCHCLQTGPAPELKWFVAEADVLRQFHQETPAATRRRLVDATRRWVMLELRNGTPEARNQAAQKFAQRVFARFDSGRIETWSDEIWQSFCLHLLWFVCCDGVGGAAEPVAEDPGFCRHRDWLLEATGEDCDELVHEILVPFSAAFLDQGVARASLPARHSFYQAFAAVYGRPSRAFRPWMSGLAAEIRRIADRRMAPLESIEESLQLLGVDASERDAFITDSLLALRGYAGLLWQTEQRGDRVAHPAPPDSLVEFLAVRLILDRLAAEHVGRESMAFFGGAAQVRQAARRQLRPTPAAHVEQRAFLIFQLSQLLGWSPEVLHRLTRSQWTTLLAEAESFSRLERRRIYHLAYERKYQVEALDAIVLHRRRSAAGGNTSIRAPSPRPSFEIICCIDDREESFRRHLEELDPGCRTYGTAGFFAVAMYYRGAADAHFTPLCPVIIKPQHYVVEQVADMMQDADQRRRRRRQALGAAARQFHLGSRTVAGGWLAGVVGSLASVPLVMRILFPRMTARLRQAFGELVSTPAATRLQLERTESTPGEQGGHVGYRPEEMAANVERLLRDIGLTENFSKLVFVCGHGSSSLNNPHGAAYDCGACAGGRGGPNARAFAQMANRPDVRALVARNGIHIPSDTVFIGAYHNTCNDSVAYYDLDALPASHHATFEASRRRIDEARRRNAQERCRRFESARLNMSGAEALRHVEGRAEDLSQVRPECGHAGNAICLVGRREWSRNLFLDRRAFLQSYDPAQDDEHASILDRILQAVIPVCAGINLEYYFSFVDSTGYGCGSKLPHNVTSLLGVMNGASSDLLPGLPWQMVEIHEPMRLLLVIEATPAALKKIIGRHEGIARLVDGQWVQLATFDADRSEMHWYRQGRFERHVVEAADLPEVMRSIDWYRGWRDHLGFAAIRPAATEPETLGDG